MPGITKSSGLALLALYLNHFKRALQSYNRVVKKIEIAGYPFCTPNAKVGITLYILHTRVKVQSWASKKEETEGLKLTQRHISIALNSWLVLFGLKVFCSRMKNVHIYIYFDKTAAVNYFNCMGSAQSIGCNSAAKHI